MTLVYDWWFDVVIDMRCRFSDRVRCGLGFLLRDCMVFC